MPKYYLLDENKNLVEGFDKEGFLALLEQAIEQGSLENIDEDSAVASKIRSVLNGTTHHIEFVTQAQYNQLVADEELVANTWYFITDDETPDKLDELMQDVSDHETRIEALETKTSVIELGSFQDLEDVLASLYANYNDAVKFYTGKINNVIKVKLQVLGKGKWKEELTSISHTTYYVSFICYKDDTTAESINVYRKGWAYGDNQAGQSFALWTIHDLGETAYTLKDFNSINLTQTLPNFDPKKAYHFVFTTNVTSDGREMFNFGVCQSIANQGINIGTGFNPIDNRAFSVLLSSQGVPSVYRKLRDETNFSKVTDSTTLSGWRLYYKEIN